MGVTIIVAPCFFTMLLFLFFVFFFNLYHVTESNWKFAEITEMTVETSLEIQTLLSSYDKLFKFITPKGFVNKLPIKQSGLRFTNQR